VCEALLPKAVLEYKVGIVTAGGSVDDEIIYDTLNTDLCKDTNDIAFYFGDTSGVCNEPDESGYTPCTTNADCCGGRFCAFQSPINHTEQGDGRCREIEDFGPQTVTIKVDNMPQTWARSTTKGTWWTADNFCQALGMHLATVFDINYKENETPHSNIWPLLRSAGWSAYLPYWLNSKRVTCGVASFVTTESQGNLDCYGPGYDDKFALCH